VKTDKAGLEKINNSILQLNMKIGMLVKVTEDEIKPGIKELAEQIDLTKNSTLNSINCLEKKLIGTRTKINLWERIWLILLSGSFAVLVAIMAKWR